MVKDPELFIGLVGAVGADLSAVVQLISQELTQYRYTSKFVHLAELLTNIPKYSKLRKEPVDSYLDDFMWAGSDFRHLTERGDAVAILGLNKIRMLRRQSGVRKQYEHVPRQAYLIRSLKHPDEVACLRQVYGSSFVLAAAYAPEHVRRQHLAKRIAVSRNEFPIEKHLSTADEFIQRDQEEFDTDSGQYVRETFHLADVFFDASDPDELRPSVRRSFELIFGNTFNTPSRDEFGMFHAKASALRSAELGRQVGAAIATSEGDVVALGTNEVPRAGGGLYWCNDKPDKRQFVLGIDSNDEQIRILVSDTINRLRSAKWLSAAAKSKSVEALVSKALEGKKAILRDSRVKALIEFGRAVHGEMAALSDAARRGVSVNGCTMYVTTFPCHLCARHIVAAGIRRVVYIEPYAKSLAAELYPDSIAIDTAHPRKHQVPFEPFLGVAPTQYFSLFSMQNRKEGGKVKPFEKSKAELRAEPPHPRAYEENEIDKIGTLKAILKKKAL